MRKRAEIFQQFSAFSASISAIKLKKNDRKKSYLCTFRYVNYKRLIVRKLYLFIGLILCVTLPFSAVSQEDGTKKEKTKKEKKAVNPDFKHKFTTFHLEARADFEYNYEHDEWGYVSSLGVPSHGEVTQHNYGFRGDYFNFLLGGDIGKHISYFFRQRIIPAKGVTELFDNTDFLYVQYKFNDQWSLRMGKEAIFVGGYEYDAPPIDVYYYTHYWGAFPCFLLGVSAAYTDKSGNNKIVLNVANSPYVKYLDNRWNSGLLSYNLYWSGKFGPFSTLYSVNFLEYQRGKFINFIALGNKLSFNKWSIYVDYVNRAAGFKNFFKDFSVVSRLDWHVSPSVNLFAKGGFEQNSAGYYYTPNGHGYPVDVDMLMSNNLAHSFYGLGVEFRPRVYPDLRVHAFVANSVNTLPRDIVGDYGFQDMTLTANVGVTWRLDFMKFLPAKLKN